MFGFRRKRNREAHRYYLLPGMGRCRRKRHKQIMRWSIVVAVVISTLLCGLLYYINNH